MYGSQFVPPLLLRNTPPCVLANRVCGLCGLMASVVTSRLVRPVLTVAQVVPPSVLLRMPLLMLPA